MISNNKTEKRVKQTELRKLSHIFYRWLFVCVAIAFLATGAFTYMLQTQIAISDTEQLLTLNLEDVKRDIHDASDRNLLALTREIADLVTENSDTQILNRIAGEYGVSEINIIDSKGKIVVSTKPEYIGFDMASGEQSAKFLVLLEQEEEFVQEYGAATYDPTVSMKYAGVSLPFGGFLQIAYNSERFQKDIDGEVIEEIINRNV